MINALVILFVAAIFFAFGVRVTTVRANRILDRMAEEREETREHNEAYLNGDLPPMTADDVIAAGWFDHVLVYDCPEEHAVSGQLCDTGGMWVCLERIRYAREMEEDLYDAEISHNEQLPDLGEGIWEEVEISSECGYGCKIYQHTKTGRRVLAHNSVYGCRR